MSLKIEGTNLSVKLDEKSLKAYAVSAVIGRQKESGGGRVHTDQALSFLKENHPNLEIDYKTFVDIVRKLSDEGVLIREVPENDDPIYGFNPNYFIMKK